MTKDSAKILRVTDSSCTAETPVREHDVFVRGVLTRTVFKFGEETLLAFEHGIKFMIDGFKVEESDGRTLNLPAVTKESIRAELAADQVIANLSELTLASLKLRAGQKPGGEVYLDAGDDARADLIAFIMGKPPVGVADESVDGHADLVDDEGDDDDSQPQKIPAVASVAGIKLTPVVQPTAPQPQDPKIVLPPPATQGPAPATKAPAPATEKTVPAGNGPVTSPFKDDKGPVTGNGKAGAAVVVDAASASGTVTAAPAVKTDGADTTVGTTLNYQAAE